MKTTINEVRRLLDRMPKEASLEDIQYHIYVRQKVCKGLEAAHGDRVISQDEVEKRMVRWIVK